MKIITLIQMDRASSADHLRRHVLQMAPGAEVSVDDRVVKVSYDPSMASIVGEAVGGYLLALESYEATSTEIKLKDKQV